MSTAVAKSPRYDSQQVSRGLIELAACNGNTSKAAARLEAAGLPIDQSTLSRWKRSKADEYQRVREEVMPALRERAAEESLDLAEQYAALSNQFTARLAQSIDEIPARDLPGAARNIATSRAIELDKASQLRGEATGAAGTDKRTVKELLRGLKAKGAAVSVVDGEVVSEEVVGP